MAAPVEAIVLAEIGAVVPIVASSDPILREGLRREWEALRQPSGDTARIHRTVQALEGEVARARKRLTDAAVLLVDGTIDKAGYEHLRDKATADLEAAEAELARLRGVAAMPTLPAFDDVLREAGGWAAAIRDANTSELREVIGILVEGVLPVRRRVGRYDARITWTPAGKALRRIVRRQASAA
ncbi:MAG: hypothetical protein M3O34_03800 [Chloroflexota bacterium]|nr:hypothetical protein [Chloroflexota bacterium]